MQLFERFIGFPSIYKSKFSAFYQKTLSPQVKEWWVVWRCIQISVCM